MLTLGGAERISPEEILSHSFINRTPRQLFPTAGSRGDDSQVDRLPLGDEVKTANEKDDGDVKIRDLV